MLFVPAVLCALLWGFPFKDILRSLMEKGKQPVTAFVVAALVSTLLTGGVCVLCAWSDGSSIPFALFIGCVVMPICGFVLCLIYPN